MKKPLLPLFIIALIFSISAKSQSTLPNGNFNLWDWIPHPTHAAGGFYEPGGDFFKSLNILDTIATPPGLTCYRSDEVHSGEYALRLLTQQIAILQIIIPGVVGTLKLNWATLNATLGVPYTYPAKATSFQGWYKMAPISGDSAGATVLLSKWNPVTHQRDTIGSKRLVFRGTVSEYTFFDAAIEYKDPNTLPDSITVLLLSSAGYNTSNMLGSVGKVGSQAWFDDITLTDVNGFRHQLIPEVEVKLYPNPAKDVMIAEVGKTITNGQLEIYSMDGKLLLANPLMQLKNQVSVSSLPNGSYYYKFTDGKSVLNSGTFLVNN